METDPQLKETFKKEFAKFLDLVEEKNGTPTKLAVLAQAMIVGDLLSKDVEVDDEVLLSLSPDLRNSALLMLVTVTCQAITQ